MKTNKSFLENENINKLLIKLSTPAAIGMLVMMLYSAIDMFFVGRYVGVNAITGLSFIMPIGFLIPAVGMAIGIGGASLVSRKLGEKNYEQANESLGNIVSLTVLICTFCSLLAFGFKEEVLDILGTTENVRSLTKEYYLITLIGFPFLGIMMSLNNILRAEGKAVHSMWFMISSALLNVILDIVFIIWMKQGLAGAAIATVISQVIPAIYLLYYYLKNKTLRIKRDYLKINKEISKEIFGIGISSFARQTSATLVAIVLNRGLIQYGNDSYVAVYGILNRIIMFVYFPVIGLIQGFLPIAGYNYGAKNYVRLMESLKTATIWSFIIGILSSILLVIFSESLFGIFTEDNEIITVGSEALEIIIIFYALVSVQVMTASYFQAIGNAKSSFILTMSRQVLFLIPLALLLPMHYGLKGLWLAFPISDFLSILLTLFYFLPEWVKLKKRITNQEYV